MNIYTNMLILPLTLMLTSVSHADFIKKAFSGGNKCSSFLSATSAASSPTNEGLWSKGSGLLNQAAESTKGIASSTADFARMTADLTSSVEATMKILNTVQNKGANALEHTSLFTKEVTLRLPSAGVRLVKFDLTPMTFIDELAVPLLAIIKEYETDSYNESSIRRAKVESTLVVRATETGFKGLKAGVFGILPDPFSFAYDFVQMNHEIANSKKNEESLMREMLEVLYVHMQKEIIDPDPTKSINQRLQNLAALKPVLEQVSGVLGERLEGFKKLADRNEMEVWLETKVEDFRFDEFGVKDSEEVQASSVINALGDFF